VSRRAWLAAAVALVGGLLTAYGVSGALRVRALQREVAAAERELDALRARAAELSAVIERLRHDPAYIEKLGREEHGFVREGETVLKFSPRSQ
jgi:cell division protein FtsB